MREQEVDEVTDQIRGRLVPGGQECVAGREQFVAAEAGALLLRQRERGDHVVLRFAAPRVNQPVHVVEQLEKCLLRSHRRREGRHARSLKREDVGRPTFEKRAILRRRAEHLGDEHDRQRVGDSVDEIERPAARHCLGEHALRERADARFDRGDGFRRERLLDQRAHARVIGRVRADHVLLREVVPQRRERRALALRQPAEQQRLAVLVRKIVGVAQRLGDVVEPADDPRVPRLAPEHRVLVAEPPIDRVRVPHDLFRNEQAVQRRIRRKAGRHDARSMRTPTGATTESCVRARGFFPNGPTMDGRGRATDGGLFGSIQVALRAPARNQFREAAKTFSSGTIIENSYVRPKTQRPCRPALKP